MSRLHPLTPLLKGARMLALGVAAISWQGYAGLGPLRWAVLVAVLLVVVLAVRVAGEPGLAPLGRVQPRIVPAQRPDRGGAAAAGGADKGHRPSLAAGEEKEEAGRPRGKPPGVRRIVPLRVPPVSTRPVCPFE